MPSTGTIATEAVNIHRRANEGQYATPGENYLADRLIEAIDLIGSLAAEVDKLEKMLVDKGVLDGHKSKR